MGEGSKIGGRANIAAHVILEKQSIIHSETCVQDASKTNVDMSKDAGI
nr:hypothetical protein [Xylella fastidiosa]